MPRPRTELDLSPSESKFLLDALYRDGHISRPLLEQYRARMAAEITTIEARLARLRALAGEAVHRVAAVVSAAAPAVTRAVGRATTRRKAQGGEARRKSPARAATQKLQGKYLGLLRQMPASAKRRFGKEAIAAKGKEAVIAEMEAHLRPKARKGGKKK
jgi:hypothetical protein